MSDDEFQSALGFLGLSQAEAARLLSVSERTVRRWAEDPQEMPGPATQALRAWCRLHRMKAAWRPDGVELGTMSADEVAEQIALHREHTIQLDALLERVRTRGGPSTPWNVDLDKCSATLGPIWISFHPLASGSFSPAYYRRSDKDGDLNRDRQLIEDGYACIAAAIAAAGKNWATRRGQPRDQPAVTIRMNRRMLYIPVLHIDTNLINARGKLDTMNRIEKWAEDEVILVNMSGVSFKEAQDGNDAQRTRKALSHIFTLTDETINPTDPLYVKIETALFPDGVGTKNQQNDVKIVYEAAKYSAILVTRDGASRRQPGGMLGNRDKLKDIVQILSDTEAVGFVQAKILERDNFNLRVHREFGVALPGWTGTD